MKKEKLIIIGSGPAGWSAAIYAARADLAPLVFEGTEPGGQLMGTTEVENFPGFPDGVMGPVLMNSMREQAQKFGTRNVFKTVDRVDFSDTKNLKLYSGEDEFLAESVIIATGASARWLNLGKGEEKFYGKGYSACATCDGAFFRDKAVAVVGGGDSACEEANFLTKFASKVYLVVRGSELRASLPLQKRVKENDKVEILWEQGITDLRGENKLESVELTKTNTTETSELDLDGVFVAIGHTPNTKFLDGQVEVKNGYIVAKEGSTQTSVESVFAAGDVVDFKYQQAISAAGDGCRAFLDAQGYLSE